MKKKDSYINGNEVGNHANPDISEREANQKNMTRTNNEGTTVLLKTPLNSGRRLPGGI